MFDIIFKARNQGELKKETHDLKVFKGKESGTNWLRGAGEKSAIEVGKALLNDKINDLVEVTLIDRKRDNDNFHFYFDDGTKKVFIAILNSKWEAERNIFRASVALQQIDVVERRLGKKFTEFNKEETEDFILNAYKEFGYNGTKFVIKIFFEYAQLFSDNKLWRHYYNGSEFSNLVGESKEKKYITKKEVLDLYDSVENKQIYVVLLLIFVGVRFSSTVPEKDELRYLKVEDIEENKIIIRNGLNPREIEIDNDFYERIIEATKQRFIITSQLRDYEPRDLVSSPYIIKPQRKGNNDGKPISGIGIVHRIDTIAEEIDTQFGLVNCKQRMIVTSGKKFYVDRYLADGYDLPTALRLALKQFDDWDYFGDTKRENIYQTNTQRVARLKKVWQSL